MLLKLKSPASDRALFQSVCATRHRNKCTNTTVLTSMPTISKICHKCSSAMISPCVWHMISNCKLQPWFKEFFPPSTICHWPCDEMWRRTTESINLSLKVSILSKLELMGRIQSVLPPNRVNISLLSPIDMCKSILVSPPIDSPYLPMTTSSNGCQETGLVNTGYTTTQPMKTWVKLSDR